MTSVGSPTNFGVRPAAPADAVAIAAVQAAAWTQDYSDLLPADILATYTGAGSAAVWERAISAPGDPTGRVLVAHDGAVIVGFLAWTEAVDPDLSDRDVEIVEFAVSPDQRGKGHGSRLLAAWADLARASFAGVGVTWLPAASGAADFLLGAGFVADGASREVALSDDARPTLALVRLATSLAAPPPEPA
jgi:GNAT superfamily N-acetyltransferase